MNHLHAYALAIAVAVTLIEAIPIAGLIRSFWTAKRRLLPVEEFRNLIADTDYDSIAIKWIKHLSWTLGHQRGISELKSYIIDELTVDIYRIRFFSNLGPAFGLMATFAGMLVLVRGLSGGSMTDLNAVYSSVQNMFPIFWGGFLGIGVYAYGNFLQRKTLNRVYAICDGYLEAYIEAEKLIIPADPTEAVTAYKKLLKPITDLVKKLSLVNDGFNNFVEKLDENNRKFDKSFEELDARYERYYANIDRVITSVREVSESTHSDLRGYMAKIDELAEGFRKYNENLAGSVSRWEKFYDNVDTIITSLGTLKNIMGGLEAVSDTLRGVMEKVDVQTEGISAFREEITKLFLQLSSNVEKLSALEEGFDEFLDKIPPGHIAEIALKMENIGGMLDESLRGNREQLLGSEGLRMLLENVEKIRGLIDTMNVELKSGGTVGDNGIYGAETVYALKTMKAELKEIKGVLDRKGRFWKSLKSAIWKEQNDRPA